MWGMDLMERFLRTQNGYEYLIVAVDYFSKWIEENVLNFFTIISSTDTEYLELLLSTMELNSLPSLP